MAYASLEAYQRQCLFEDTDDEFDVLQDFVNTSNSTLAVRGAAPAPENLKPCEIAHTPEGQDAIWKKLGPITAQIATQMLRDNQVHIDGEPDPTNIDGEQLLYINACLGRPGSLECLFYIDGDFTSLEALRRAHPALGARDPREYFERQEIGVYRENPKQLRNTTKQLRQEVFYNYYTRDVDSGIPFAPEMNWGGHSASSPQAIVQTAVYVARERWKSFVTLERLAGTLMQFEPKGAALLIGPAAAARVGAAQKLCGRSPALLIDDAASTEKGAAASDADETEDTAAEIHNEWPSFDEVRRLVRDAETVALRAETAAAQLREVLRCMSAD